MEILQNPRFINCIRELDIVNNPDAAMPAYARCASLIGRPRFGKRSGPMGPMQDGEAEVEEPMSMLDMLDL